MDPLWDFEVCQAGFKFLREDLFIQFCTFFGNDDGAHALTKVTMRQANDRRFQNTR